MLGIAQKNFPNSVQLLFEIIFFCGTTERPALYDTPCILSLCVYSV